MLTAIRAALSEGDVIPYLGAGALALTGPDCPVPASPEALVAKLTATTSVPHKIRHNLTGAAQFIENFKHRKTLVFLMQQAFAPSVTPSPLHRFLAEQPAIKLIVHAWYDNAMQQALAGRDDWGIIQGVSQAEHYGRWTHAFDAKGVSVEDAKAAWNTVLYEPIGAVTPASNFLVSDSDYVEVLTEIDIQTPIPDTVQRLRTGRHFLYLGCRFSTQIERIYAHQISKRSSDQHWMVLPETPTRNEARFMAQHGITRIDMSLEDFAEALAEPVRVPA